VYPLDTIKTRVQSPDYRKLYKDGSGKVNRSLFRGLYQGIGPVIFVTIPSSGAFFTTYEALKYNIGEAIPPNSTIFLPQPAINAISSGGAELVSCAILTPAEVLKQNAQVIVRKAGEKRRSPVLTVLKEFRSKPWNLWRGYTALAARNLPYTALQFPIFEHLKNNFLAKRKKAKNDQPVDGILERAVITAGSASIAGSGAAWITTPIDVIKTRIMLSASKDSEQRPVKVEKRGGLLGMVETSNKQSAAMIARQILKQEGITGLFRGAAIRSVWTAMGSGLYLGVYESGRFYLEDERKAREAREGDSLMQKTKDWSKQKVGIGASRSQGDKIKKSAWQDD
jgi:solute carrier family 25 (mitochondrial S-adenosylmethionine transporter), member 26